MIFLSQFGITVRVFLSYLNITIAVMGAVGTTAARAQDDSEMLSPKSAVIYKYLTETITPLVDGGKIPGAVIAIVEGDNAAVLKGFGYADIASKTPMSPQKTLVRVGSITKSFTALAIHQLIEQGKIALDQDANNYLISERIPEAFDVPVTIEDLLTHRAGFDGNISFVSGHSYKDTQIEQGWMSRQFIRLKKPGELFAYDNTAYAALGQILVDQEKASFKSVIEHRVLNPLGMSNSVVGLPEDRRGDVATCYNGNKGSLAVCDHQLLKETYQAAGDLSATAEDMGKFLRALLNKGKTETGRLLSEAQFAEFSTTKYRLHADGPGIGLGAYEMGPAGQGTFGHSGGIRGGSSFYIVMPRQNIAVFVAINSSSSTEIKTTLTSMVALATSPSVPDSYDPGELTTFTFSARIPTLLEQFPKATPIISKTCKIEDIEGDYQYIRPLMFSSLAIRYLGALALEPVKVEKLADGAWSFENKGPYDEIAPCHFQLRDSGYTDGEFAEVVSFAETSSGDIVAGSHPLAAWIKLPWHANPAITVIPYPIGILVLIFFGVFGLIGDKNSRFPFKLGAAGAVLILVGFILEMQYETPVYQYGGIILPMLAWRLFSIIGLGILVFSITSSVQAMRKSETTLARSILLSITISASVLTIILSLYWGVFG